MPVECADAVHPDEPAIRSLLKDFTYPADSVQYGVALWRISSVAADAAEEPSLRLEFTCAPMQPADVVVAFTLTLPRSQALDPSRLTRAVERRIAEELGA